MESEEQDIGLHKGYKVSIHLKENYHPRYIQASWVPIHILPIVVSKFKKMIQKGILENVTQKGSNWASPIVAIKKIDEDIRICDDYKIGVNHQICSNSFPLPSTETASHELANMKLFVEIDLKLTYNQIKTDNKFKEITTLNTSMGLLRWSCLPFRIKTVRHIF